MAPPKPMTKRLERTRARFRADWRKYEQEPPSVAEAAKYFGISSRDPKLLYLLADAVFAPMAGRSTGSKTAWGETRLLELAFIYRDEKYEHPKLSDHKLAALICKHKQFSAYANDPEQVRQKLREADWVYEEWQAWSESHLDYAREPDEDSEDDYGYHDLV
jgi:hypothetical protein